jgi:methylated-DNA-[protein]-cysteine S-methyltransferase
MANNKTPLLVPCHRVVGQDGSLVGFGKETKQLDLKQRLLELEQLH